MYDLGKAERRLLISSINLIEATLPVTAISTLNDLSLDVFLVMFKAPIWSSVMAADSNGGSSSAWPELGSFVSWDPWAGLADLSLPPGNEILTGCLGFVGEMERDLSRLVICAAGVAD